VVAANRDVFYKTVPYAQAKEINGLRAVFGERYPDPVRVVAVGIDIDALLAEPTKDWGALYSIEFCGGTHLRKTGAAKGYVTLSEQGIAQGVRRIVGATGAEAQAAIEVCFFLLLFCSVVVVVVVLLLTKGGLFLSGWQGVGCAFDQARGAR
jgi:alanyl-tRNA synthetase